ncbi:homeotic protein female sterile [Biomphalaria pfeifferi]|uniref:Homeotic protein female sterile n=1 Tax=Biomphalaria pfeifferi TaxID=112525 RepID=A0AAD8AXR3_BIOPF|nr:homeotic protein female sterile [Biomphalaria pfeifferi]
MYYKTMVNVDMSENNVETPQRTSPAPPKNPQKTSPAPPKTPQRTSPAPPKTPQRTSPAPPKTPQRTSPAPPKTPNENEESKRESKSKKGLILIASGLAGIGAVAMAPAALTAAGFGAAGITAGSLGASMVSLATNSGIGMGLVSVLQSAGAAGIGMTGNTLIGLGGAAVGGGMAAAATGSSTKEQRKSKEKGSGDRATQTPSLRTNTSKVAESPVKELGELDISVTTAAHKPLKDDKMETKKKASPSAPKPNVRRDLYVIESRGDQFPLDLENPAGLGGLTSRTKL